MKLSDKEMEDLSYKNLSRLVTSPDLLSHLQGLKLDGGEKIVSFQWLGPHFLTFLKYATKLSSWSNISIICKRFDDLLKRLDDSASYCILYRDTEHRKNFLEIILYFMPQIGEFFTMQNLLQLSDSDSSPNTNEHIPEFLRSAVWESFINFLFETLEELLNCQSYCSVLVSNQVNVLLKELKFLLTFLVDTMLRFKKEENKNVLTEIESVFNEAGLFLHSFFFTTDLVTTTKMNLAVFVLLERIEIVQVKIKYHCIAVSMKLNCGIGNQQAAESPSEVSSQDKSSPMVEEIIVGFEDMTTKILSKLLGGPNYCQIISIVGMGGLGKTTLAKKIYNDSNVWSHFDKLSWCVVSQTYIKRKLLIDILSSVINLNKDKISQMEDEELAECLYKNLKGRRYLIVMDDLWDIHAWDDLKRYFPDDNINRSRVLFTSRLKNIASEISHVIIEPPLLSSGDR